VRFGAVTVFSSCLINPRNSILKNCRNIIHPPVH